MIRRSFATKAMKLFQYIAYEKETLISGEYSQEDVKRIFLKGSPHKYSCAESNGKIIIKRKSIIFPSSHYIAIAIEPKIIRCEVRMNQIERALLLALISMIFLFVLALPVIAGAAVFLPINKYNLAIVTPLILVTSIALVMWLKFICFVLAYISGVTKIGSQVARAIDPR